MTSKFAIVDLFAGPGGLAEGFSSIRTNENIRPFTIALSVEKEHSAYETLLLRSFLRQFDRFPKEYYDFLNGEISEPDWNKLYPRQWKAASNEALKLELGSKSSMSELNIRLDAIREKHGGKTILIGGPPCQAYSLVGRARNKGIADYNASEDHRHFLYQEYIRILKRLRPAAFVMENVKGMLSSVVDGEGVFEKVLKDLRLAGRGDEAYKLVPLIRNSESKAEAKSTDFIVRAENFGLPQARHRVIVVGIRSDIVDQIGASKIGDGILAGISDSATVRDVLEGMPRLRSGLSKSKDSEKVWKDVIDQSIKEVLSIVVGLPKDQARLFKSKAKEYGAAIKDKNLALSRVGTKPGISSKCPKALRKWLLDSSLKALPNNETRGHMPTDLARYFFAALFGEITGISPKASHYPAVLAPEHRNWTTGKFADRFRVQLWDQPSTTVTCHISKDGHYFIHPDPLQCRSLTVREAARLQTFPDNYYFKGNRTQQYVQVGNAVPPYLARQIAESLYSLLIHDIKREKAAAVAKKNKNMNFQGRISFNGGSN